MNHVKGGRYGKARPDQIHLEENECGDLCRLGDP